MKLDLDFLLVCVYAQDKKILKLAFFSPNSENIQKLRKFLTNFADLGIKKQISKVLAGFLA